jgi:DNA adenine methylase
MSNNLDVSITDVVKSKSSPDTPITELKPFLRWAGGKRQLLDRIHKVFPREFSLDRNSFYEPFIGGGALTFSLASGQFGATSSKYSRQSKVLIGDQNPDLVAVYTTIRDDVDSLIELLKSPRFKISEDAYYRVRNMNCNQTGVEAAARFIYLNRLCFNGLYRVNSTGRFNVPYGRISNPTICDEPLLRAISSFLSSVDINHGSFEDTTSSATAGDLVYFDPPYIPVSPTASFTKYSTDDFAEQDHLDLMSCIVNLTNRGVNVILSNSYTEKTCEIYGSGPLQLYTLTANRSISASSKSRQKTSEVIGVSYDIDIPAGLKIV